MRSLENTTLVVRSGPSFGDILTSIIRPERAASIQLFRTNGSVNHRMIRLLALDAIPGRTEIGWDGVLIEKQDGQPAISSVGRWHTSREGTRMIHSGEKTAAGRLVLKRRGWLRGLHRNAETGELTFVYSDADVAMAPANQAQPISFLRRLF